MRHAIIIDGRNCFKTEDMKKINGIVYDSIGRAPVDNRDKS